MQPKWGTDELLAFFKNDELGLPTFTLDQYGILFSRMAFKSSKAKSRTGISVFATLSERRDTSLTRGPEHVHHPKKCTSALPNLSPTIHNFKK
jgi:hypothetical protein